MMNDEPRIWTEEIPGEINEEDYYNQESAGELVQVEENPLPTLEEQKAIVETSDITPENKSMLGQLIEISKVSQVLKNLTNTEVEEQRSALLDATCAVFIQARMQNNMQLETLKQKVIKRLEDNIENMDLELANEVLTNIAQVTSTDATNAMSNIRGGMPGVSNGGMPGVNLTINNATAEGSQITTNTLNANPQQVQQLKEVASLNSSLKAWSNIPGKKPVIQAQITDTSGK